jgi:methylated-DNA-[protein]-cysteine S-methyltransferase
MQDRVAVCVDTEFGPMRLIEESGAITGLDWRAGPADAPTALLIEARTQLRAYLAGKLTRFDLPLRVSGSVFQQAVCQSMIAIRFGQTRTYGQIAAELGASAQAVGRACGANPIAVIIPCHRVMGADGRLTGYSGKGGIETKVALLRHEGAAGLLI